MKLDSVVMLIGMAIATSAGAATSDQAGDIERSVHAIQTAFDKGDVATLQTLMTEDHVTILTYARFSDRASQLKVLSDFRFSDYVIDDLGVKALTDDAALVTYRATIKGTFKGKPVPSPVRVTETWIKRDAKWMQAAYVETPASKGGGRPKRPARRR